MSTRHSAWSRLSAGAIAAGVLVTSAGLAAPAVAQEVRVRATMGDGPGRGAEQVSKRSLDRYAELLALTPEQVEQAGTIHEGYSAALAQARKARGDALSEARRAADDADDHSEFMKRMGALQQEFRDRSTKLEKDFFADLRGILTPAQESSWGGVERHRRREVGLRGEVLSGAGVDLGEVVRGLKLEGEAMAALVPAVDEYELDLDRQLQENLRRREQNQAGMPGMGMGGMAQLNPEDMTKRMEAMREAGAKVQELNERHARKMEGLLPESAKAAFREELQKRSFPRVYRPSRVAKDLEAALKLNDLTTDQRESLEALRRQYTRDLAPANTAWANAIRDKERAGGGGAFSMPGGGVMMLDTGDDPESLTAARKARREIDEKANDRLRSVLSPDQREKLPKPEPEEVEGGWTGQAIMIHSETTTTPR